MVKDVSQYAADRRLQPLKVLYQTLTSTIHEVALDTGEKAILKILTPLGVEDEAPGAVLLDWYGGNGAVHILKYDEGAHLLEYLPGPTLTSHVKEKGDAAATDILITTIKNLQTPRPQKVPPGLVSLKARFRELYKSAHSAPLFSRAAALADELLNNQTQAIPLHGDLRHENLMHSVRGWLALDPKGLIGDPVYETANIFGNPRSMPELACNKNRIINLAGRFASALGFDKMRILKFAAAHTALSACWDIMDGLDPAHAMRISELVVEVLDNA